MIIENNEGLPRVITGVLQESYHGSIAKGRMFQVKESEGDSGQHTFS